MKNGKRTMILIYVKAPSSINHQKMAAIQQKLTDAIVTPFKCDKKVNYSRSHAREDAIMFFIFKDGHFKNSIKSSLIKKLEDMHKCWGSMLGYSLMHCDGIDVETTDGGIALEEKLGCGTIQESIGGEGLKQFCVINDVFEEEENEPC